MREHRSIEERFFWNIPFFDSLDDDLFECPTLAQRTSRRTYLMLFHVVIVIVLVLVIAIFVSVADLQDSSIRVRIRPRRD